MFRRVLARLALEVGPPAVVVTLIAVLVVQHPARPAAEYAPVQAANRLSITVATHFDAWQHPDEAITSVLRREHPEIISTVAIGAGRWEWNFFAWKGHEATWSNDQRSSLTDLLAGGARAVASANVGAAGARLASVGCCADTLPPRTRSDSTAPDHDRMVIIASLRANG